MWTSGETIVSTRLVDKNDLNLSGQYAGIAAAPLSSGNIAFANSSGALLSDSGHFWDNTNKRLGVGTAAPLNKLQIVGASSVISGDGIDGILQITTGTGINTDEKLQFTVHDDGYSVIQAIKPGTTTRNLLLNPLGGNVGIGVFPTSPLHVVGLPIYANNAAAVSGGHTVGAFYRTGEDPDLVCVVH